MAIRLYNTLTRTKEEFVPREPGKVAMYVCGPTVYNHVHIGNARTFLTFDVVRRYLTWRGYQVDFVQNITDVDDKIIRRAAEEGVSAHELAQTYMLAFRQAMAEFGIQRPTVSPLATEMIDPMIAMVQRLIDTEHAYAVDGDVYFSVRSFPGYGKLSGRDVDDLRSGARVEVDVRKHDPLDFALWKSAKPGEPHWTSPWGEGRPGWHLECSVMSECELGVPFDIHGGGADLVFPHHENEIAQSEAATGTTFARYWMHGGMLQIDSEKMSKSLGNFLLLKDVLAEYPAPIVRLLMLQTHYRNPLDYSAQRLIEARRAYERITGALRDLVAADEASFVVAPATDEIELAARLSEALSTSTARFSEVMDDDFNTAGALAIVFDLARLANTFVAEVGLGTDLRYRDELRALGVLMHELLGVLGIDVLTADENPVELPHELVDLAHDLSGYAGTDPAGAVDSLLAAREAARVGKNWTAADAIRDGLVTLGLTVEDTPAGPRLLQRPKD